MIPLDYWYVYQEQKDKVVRYVPTVIHVLAQGRYRTLTLIEEENPSVAVALVEKEKEEKKKEPVLTVYFGFDKYKLTPQEKEKLKSLEKKEYLLVGHADWIGSEEYNYKLSERRAKEVEKELRKLGIDRVEPTWKGEQECKIKKELEGKAKISKSLIEELQPCRNVEVWER